MSLKVSLDSSTDLKFALMDFQTSLDFGSAWIACLLPVLAWLTSMLPN